MSLLGSFLHLYTSQEGPSLSHSELHFCLRHSKDRCTRCVADSLLDLGLNYGVAVPADEWIFQTFVNCFSKGKCTVSCQPQDTHAWEFGGWTRETARSPHVPLAEDSKKEKWRLDQIRRAGLLSPPWILRMVSLSLSQYPLTCADSH